MDVPSPELIFDTLTGYQRAAALKAAIDLDVFTHVADGAATAGDVAARCAAAERGARILCDALVVYGFLGKDGQRYSLTPTSEAFLVRTSPTFIGSIATFLGSTMIREAFADIAATVRNGGTVVPDRGTLGPDHPIWVDFARSMAPLAGLSARMLAGVVSERTRTAKRVLDVAAGHGLFGITLAAENPEMEVVAQDWGNVLQVAQENADAAGLGSRFTQLPGSAFEVSFGGPYDLVLLTNFLHHFDAPTCEGLLRKVRAALADGGAAITLEAVPDEDRVAPAAAATFSLVMLATTPAGDAYTFSELEAMFQRAGFRRSELRELPVQMQRVVVSER